MTTPRQLRQGIPQVVTLTIGLALGWMLAGSRTPALLANGGDRWEESILATGPTYIRYNEGSKIQVAEDAIYYLDYRSGKLHATIPSMQSTGGSTTVLSPFGERDLVADFKIDLDAGTRPHFLMTTGSVPSNSSSTYGDGWAALFVFETTTRQVAAYKIQQKSVGGKTAVGLTLLEVRPFGAQPPATR